MAEDYKIMDRESEQSVRLEFNGMFEGRQVIWHAHIQTLDACYHELLHKAIEVDRESTKRRQFIEIEVQNNTYHVAIGLNLSQIDESAIKMAIIMMRKYKRLHRGRHEYGEAIQIKAEPG